MYAPFKPHPAIERNSNLAKVVSLVDARANRDHHGQYPESEGSESDSDSVTSIVTDSESVDASFPGVLESSPYQPDDVQTPPASGTIKAVSRFPMPPSPSKTAALAGKNNGSSAQVVARRQHDLDDVGTTSSPSIVNQPVSRVLVRASRIASSSEVSISNAHSNMLNIGRHASDAALFQRGQNVGKNMDKFTTQEHTTLRGQLRNASGQRETITRSATMPGQVNQSPSDNGADNFVSLRAREANKFSSVAEWVPTAVPTSKSQIHNLPAWDGRSQTDIPRSTQNQQINREIDTTMRKLMSEDLFGRLLEDTLGKHRFRDFLSRTHCTSIAKLDMLTDISTYTKTLQQLKNSCEAIHDLYLAEDSPDYVQDMPSLVASELIESLRAAFHLPVSTEPVHSHLLKSLYQNEFQRFIKKQLVEDTKVRLGKLDLGDDQTGLGDCFCLTNPRLKENPIVLISDGFEALTGYPAQAVIGYNCRFLQSSGTSAESVQRIRNALNSGEGCCEVLLNYRKDGTPFWNLLNIIPLRDTEGRLAYFLAGQVEITGALASSKGLGFLLGGAGSVDDMTGVRDRVSINGNDFSPTISRYLRARNKVSEEGALDLGTAGSVGDRRDSEVVGSSRRNSIKSDAASNTRHLGGFERGRTHQSSEGNEQLSDRRLYPASTVGSDITGKSGNMLGRMTSKFRGRNVAADKLASQQIGGAETTLRRGTFNLDDQMAYFSDVYSKVIVFKRHKREVIFVTPELLNFLGYRTATNKETFNSSLIHSDLLSLICGSDGVETKAIRASVKEAVKAGKEFSIMACVKVRSARGAAGLTSAAARLFGSTHDSLGQNGTGQDLLSSGHSGQDRRYVTIHLTPLKDSTKASFAFVGIIA